MDTWHERISPLDLVLPTGLRRRKKRERPKRERPTRERKKERFRERVSTFYLEFSVIRPSNSDEATSKVGLHYKGYTWVPVLWSFENSER